MSDQVEEREGPREYVVVESLVAQTPTFPSDIALVSVNGEQVAILFALRSDGLGLRPDGDKGRAYPKAAIYMSLDQAKGLVDTLQKGVALALEQRKKTQEI